MDNTYWNGKGKYEQEYNQIKSLIPNEGEVIGNPSLETLRQVINAYYDIYNNGACNAHRFQSLTSVVESSSLPKTEKRILQILFGSAANDKAEIYFRPSTEPDESVCDIFYVDQFEEPLEHLADWAVLQAYETNKNIINK